MTPEKTLFFCGDPHGSFAHIVEAVRAHRPAAVILLGDLQPREPLGEALRPVLDLTELWWIHGNHDTDSDAGYERVFGSALAARNLHARVVNVAGVRIAGLGGVFRERIWRPPASAHVQTQAEYVARCKREDRWRGGLPRTHYSTIFPADYDALLRQRADVLITHEAPDCHPHGFPAITQLARRLGVKAAFHGHHHELRDYRAMTGKNGFDAFGVGLRGITDLTGNVIVRGEVDEPGEGRQDFR